MKKVTASNGEVALVGEVIIPGETALVTNDKRLGAIPGLIRKEWGKGNEAAFAIGRLLSEARSLFPADQNYGRWFAEQDLPFGQQVAWRLRFAAEHEDEVREVLAQPKLRGQSERSVDNAVRMLNAAPKPEPGSVKAVSDEAREVADLPENQRVDSTFSRWHLATRALLGYEVNEDGGDELPGRPFEHLHVDDLVKAAGLIQTLAGAYTIEKKARAGSA